MTLNVDEYKNLNSDNKFVTLYDLIKIFNDFRKTILIITLSVGLITGIIVFLIMDPIYQSVTNVKTTSKQGGLESLVGSSMSGISDLGDLGSTGSVAKELALYENILYSRRCIEETIIKFKLNDEWDFKYMQDAVKYFRENCLDISKDKVAGIFEIKINDKIPQRAKEIADFLIFQLNKINIELNVQHAKNNREFIEERYKNVRSDLKKAEDSLRIYQDVYGIAPDIKFKSVATAEIQFETELKSEEIKLELLKKVLAPDQSEIKMQEDKINSLKKQLSDILNNSDITNNLRLKGAPEIIVNYARYFREVELQNKLLIYVLPLYEQAKIEEKKEMPSVIVIDQPNIPEKKTKPKRIASILIAMSLTFFIVYFVLLVYKVIKINYNIAANKTI
jgi:tyrosine-protein kinase Etk/Wzc